MSFWNSTKAKVQLRLSVQRLRTLQQKKEAQAKASRRDIATLIERGKIETARIKIETIINEDIHVELLEILELYCELLLARFGLLDQNTREPDPGIIEGVCSVIHAAPRTELKELHILRDILMHKYGREFSIGVMENRDGCVSNRVLSKLTTATPSQALVDAYLREIALAYGVPWSTPDDPIIIDSPEADDKEKSDDDLATATKPAEKSADSDVKGQHAKSLSPEPINKAGDSKKSAPDPDDFENLAKRFADLKKR
ncbi:regulator of Vps4 activity in the MVB pathway-domain-containing protein [Crassisporium funariophilum]|nr:regulator of Vps4 activity in the MVB pathway-domain-containing protein [Crassisporium funariophilum]